MSNSISQFSLENQLQTVRQLYLDASLIEQTIQQHVEANKVGYRSSISSHSSPTSDRRLNLSDTSSSSRHQNQSRQSSNSSLQNQNQRRSGRQQHQAQQEDQGQGFQVPPSRYFRSSHEELTFLRDSLKDVYEVVLLEDLVAAVEKSIDERLWRHVFYAPIEELRAELRKLDKNSRQHQEVMDELSKLLDKGTGFYHEMITALRCEHDIDLESIAVEVLQSESSTAGKGNKSVANIDTKLLQSRSRSGRGRQQSRLKDEALLAQPTYSIEALANCIQKCFIYLGDLARYRTNVRLETQAVLTTSQKVGKDLETSQTRPSASDWEAAYRFYIRAFQTFPDSGKPYGQLAILATYANDDLDAIYWYTLSLGTKSPSIVVRDNLKVFFSRYQNRYKDLLSMIYPQSDDLSNAMSTDEETDTRSRPKSTSAQQLALARCDITVFFIKIQMDFFVPHLESTTFRDSNLLTTFCHKLSSKLADGGFESTALKMVASMILVIYDLHARAALSSLTAESNTKEGTLGWKQAQRLGLIYLFGMATTILDHQLSLFKQNDSIHPSPSQGLLFPIQIFIEFWLSHWDQVWGMVRMDEKWAGASNRADLSLRKATVTFFRSFISVLNIIRPQGQDYFNLDDVSQRAYQILQDDRYHFFGLMPFRRFHSQLSICFDVVEDPETTKLYRLLLFTEKVIQATESIRGTVVELSLEPVSDEDQTESGGVYYKVMDADDKRLLRERGSKVLASHWLQDQVSSLQKGLEDSERVERRGGHSHLNQQDNRRDGNRSRPLVPISTLPGTVRLPLSGQTKLTDHYQRGPPKFISPSSPQQQHGHSGVDRGSSLNNQLQLKNRPEKHSPPYWTCVVDFSVLVWHLSDVKTLLEHRKCLIIVPLDVIDRLDKAKKGQDKENQKTREAIRFLDNWLNIVRWGMSEPLLVGQNVKDSLGRWSEAIPFLVKQEESNSITNGGVRGDHDCSMPEAIEVEDQDIDMADVQKEADNKEEKDLIGEDNEIEEEIEVRSVKNVPRIWHPILGACLFLLRKRDEAHRIAQDRFILLTEDPDLLYYARWFDIPSSSILGWKHLGI